jgi:phage protein D
MVEINYNGKNITQNLAAYAVDISYTDAASGELDDLSIRVADKDRKWQKTWMPVEGDKIKVAIIVSDWYKEGDRKKYECGTFHVDGLTFSGPPDEVNIKAASFPVSSDVRQEKRVKVWEKVKLSTIAQDIAKRAKLKLVREAPDDPTYDRQEQQDKTDFTFLVELAAQEGLAVKVTGDKLVLFDEAKFEKGKSVATFTRDTDRVLDYNFEWSSNNCAYRACEVTFETSIKPASKPAAETAKDAKKKKGRPKAVKVSNKVTYTPPGAPKTGPVLRLKEGA